MNIQSFNLTFYDLMKKYDLTEPNLFRKFLHSFLVADNCFSLASSLYFNKEERDFAYLCGLVHDIGRLEQWDKFASFSDSKTRHHAQIGAALLKNGYAEKFGLDKKQQKLLCEIVLYHATPYNDNNKIVKKYLQVLRNADNYANLQNTSNGMEKLWSDKDGVSVEVLKKFRNRINLHGTPIITKLDRVLQFLSRAYSIEFPLFQKDLLSRKYLNSIYDVYSVMLNTEDRKILYEECWRLKKELANTISQTHTNYNQL